MTEFLDRKINENRSLFNAMGEARSIENAMQKAFNNNLGRRTLRVIRTFGIADKTTIYMGFPASPVSRVITSKPFDVHVPATDRDIQMRVEFDRMARMRVPGTIGHVFSLKAQFDDVSTSKDRLPSINADLRNNEYINGTPFSGNFVRRGAVGEYSEKIERFSTILSLAEAAIQGDFESVDSTIKIMSSLPQIED